MPRRFVWIAVCLATLVFVVHFGTRSKPHSPPPQQLAMAAPAPARGDTLAAPPEVRELLRNGQNWRAARLLREQLARTPEPEAGMVLLAARAEAGWGGWERVRSLLEGKSWLNGTGGGEGWFLLGRAREEDGDDVEAANAYTRYLAAVGPGEPAERRTVAGLRRGLALLRGGRTRAGSAALDSLQTDDAELRGWAALLRAEALAERADTAAVRWLLDAGDAARVSPRRARRAYLAALDSAGDTRALRARALNYLGSSENSAARAEWALAAARAALALGDTAAARRELPVAFWASPGSGSARRAADLYLDLDPVPAEERLALGRVRERQGQPRLAAANYRIWLASGRGSDAERERARLRIAEFLFAAGDYGDAEREALRLADASPDVAARALYLAGRAQYRQGEENTARSNWLRLAERFPGESSAADAVFLVADLRHDDGDLSRARIGYRRVVNEFGGSRRAPLAWMRLAGIAFAGRDYAKAARIWEGVRARDPQDDSWLQATYWAGRAYAAMGDKARAAARFREVRAREPLSYYALRSAQRLEVPFWPVALAASPAEDPAARRRVDAWMQPVDVLRAAGLYGEAEDEVDRVVGRAGSSAALLYPLAEALNGRGYTVHGVNLGYRLQRSAEQPNARLLRIVYPFPYRAMISAEARGRELDPWLVAGLIRQESVFKDRISSPVGARGLMQVMPETGRILAQGMGIQHWDAGLLFNPEINVHLGTGYLADQMQEYDGSLPSVFSAYNAGPARVERWKEFPEYRDAELFTERIPFTETRDYVKILTRNIAIYRGLYGGN